MNTLRKMRKNAKALSPVVAPIILIAVTVAVSIAVAAWMGALVVGQMSTEEAKVTSINWGASDVTLTVRNTGTTDILITEAYVNGDLTSITNINAATGGVTVPANNVTTVVLGMTPASGSNYNFQLKSAQGNTFPYVAYAP
jgi:FlaG/FlaF family flagellin (archaellin)